MSESRFGDNVLGVASIVIILSFIFGVYWFSCGGSPGLCERLCAPHEGVKRVSYVGPGGEACPCKCQDGVCELVWPWTRPFMWLDDVFAGE